MTLSPQDSRASPGQPPVSSSGSPTNATCGPIPSESCARYDPDSRSWKTSQHSLFTPTLEQFSGIWPKHFLVSGGRLYRLRKLAHGIGGSACGFTGGPTLTVSNQTDAQNPMDRCRLEPRGTWRKTSKNGVEGSINWSQWVLLLGYLPTSELAEWWMGWLIGSTGLQPLETDGCRPRLPKPGGD